MNAPQNKVVERPLMMVALENKANRELLEKILIDEFYLMPVPEKVNDETLLSTGLVIADIASLQRYRRQIIKMRQQCSPSILPVLLVADSRTVFPSHFNNELGVSADDILHLPTTRAELLARIFNLLHLHKLSREQEASRQQLIGVVSALRTLNACDSVVVRAENEDDMLSSLCSTVVSEGGYSLAWIGFAVDDEEKSVEVRASAGSATEFLSSLALGWGSDLKGSGTVGQSIRSGHVRIVDDIASEMTLAHLAERSRSFNLASAITLPLVCDTGLPGCLVIYSKYLGHFGSEERQLLERLTDNLVFGLNALRTLREREDQAHKINQLAYTDALTGLPNRRFLIDSLKEILDVSKHPASSSAILFIDLDRFKIINDALGHDVGDRVLTQVGQRLKLTVRETDQVIRHGGDEFLVLMVNDPRRGGVSTRQQFITNACTLADRIISCLEKPMLEGGFTHHITASIGISLYPEHGRDANTLIENADKAMFEAKRQGGGYKLLFSEDLSDKRQQRFSMESRLRQALDKKEFQLYYQPIFELENRRIVAVEALIRWPQNDGTVLMPNVFMPIIEETGMVKPLGDWVLETAARQLKTFHDLGHMLFMCVNVSLRQLNFSDIAGNFAALVRPHVSPHWIHLEVTENTLMVDPEATEALLEELHAKGFQLAIDDFGTGFSSLSRLQHLSIQMLKIDKSFITELGDVGSKGASLVSIIQQMAASLNLSTIAEGIETDEQRQRLMASSSSICWGQGFWFSPAVPAHELALKLRKQAEG